MVNRANFISCVLLSEKDKKKCRSGTHWPQGPRTRTAGATAAGSRWAGRRRSPRRVRPVPSRWPPPAGRGGWPQGSSPRGAAGRRGLAHQASGRGRRSPGHPHTPERPGSVRRRLPLAQRWRRRGHRPRPDGRSHTRPAPRPPVTGARAASCHAGAGLGPRRGRRSPGPPSKHRPGERSVRSPGQVVATLAGPTLSEHQRQERHDTGPT